jgi:uncharacterized protein (TIGR03382 family)
VDAEEPDSTGRASNNAGEGRGRGSRAGCQASGGGEGSTVGLFLIVSLLLRRRSK